MVIYIFITVYDYCFITKQRHITPYQDEVLFYFHEYMYLHQLIYLHRLVTVRKQKHSLNPDLILIDVL